MGMRDGNLVETVGMNVLMRSVRDPDTLAIGSQVEINGRSGVLQMARAGRARIDYNHPLAGSQASIYIFNRQSCEAEEGESPDFTRDEYRQR